MEELPAELRALIQEYRSDRVGVHPNAELIHSLKHIPDRDWGGCHRSTMFIVHGTGCFWRHRNGGRSMYASSIRLYHHSDFDERLHPQHFGIHLRWQNMLEQDDIESQIDEIGLEQFVALSWL